MPVLRAGSRGAGATAGPAPAEPQQAAKTVRTYTEAVAWFAAAHLIPRTSHARWEQISGHDVQRWLVHMLTLAAIYAEARERPWARRGLARP